MSGCQRGQKLPGVRMPAGGEGESPRTPSATAHTTATARENCRLLGGQRAAPAPGIRNLNGDLDRPSSGWDISLWLGIRIRPCEGELRSDISPPCPSRTMGMKLRQGQEYQPSGHGWAVQGCGETEDGPAVSPWVRD